jgi:hypothetical protein
MQRRRHEVRGNHRFEVKDGSIKLTRLIRDQKIVIHGFGLIGRTWDGQRGSVGTVDWAPEAKVRIARATKEISRRLEVDKETADRLWEAMSDVYEVMAGQGLCAYPGGEQSVRVIPEALEFIRNRADAMPEAED